MGIFIGATVGVEVGIGLGRLELGCRLEKMALEIWFFILLVIRFRIGWCRVETDSD